jgi:tripartite-type tricarboxylate transporter receptor subunit TctC
VVGFVRAGQLRALAVTGTTPSAALPGVPAATDFVPGYVAYAWDAMGAPANTPAAIIDTLNKAINATLADPAMKAKFADLGAEAMIMTPGEFGTYMADEVKKWGRVVRDANIKPD